MHSPLDKAHGADVQAHLRRELQIYLVRQVPLMSVVNAVNALIVGALFLDAASPVAVAAWTLTIVLFAAAQFAGWWHIRGRPLPAAVSGRTMARAGHWALAMGLAWGASAFLFFQTSTAHQMFLALLCAGMTAGTVSLLNPLPGLCLRFMLGALSPLFLMLVLSGGQLQFVTGLLTVVFGAALYQGSLKAHAQFAGVVRASFDLKLAQANLTDAIESIEDGFALFDHAGTRQLANRRFREWFPDGDALELQPGSRLRQIAGGRWVRTSTRPTSLGGTVALHTDVTALKTREQELTAAIEAAETANRAKSEFLANMSHELRTPLNAIIGFSEMMTGEALGPLGDPRYRGYAEDIQSSATHLLRIINDILDVSRIEQARYPLHARPIPADELLAWVESLSAAMPEAAGRRIETAIADGFGAIEADPKAIRQILLNLVNNALKFTPAPGRVGLTATVSAAGEPVLAVWDKGIGIPADQLDWVRKPFHQVEGPFQRRYQGTGLGLSISDALAALHGGRLAIDSREGQGTTVSVILPAERRIAAPAQRAAG